MNMLDVFKSDAFDYRALTAAFEKKPFKPALIEKLGIFGAKGIPTTTLMVEERLGQLSLITNTPRGAAAPNPVGRSLRTARSFPTCHFVRESNITADEIQNVRQFGQVDSQTAVVETAQNVVDERMGWLRPMQEVTLEWQRLCAIKGALLDADGSTTILNLFTEFGVAQQTKDFTFSSATENVRGDCVAVARQIEGELGGSPYTDIVALCSATFMDALVDHPNVKLAFQYQEGRVLGQDLRFVGFKFGGITWYEYRGAVNKADGSGTVQFVEDDYAYVLPMGVMVEGGPLFQTVFAPADFMEAANTQGLPLYAKMAFDPEGLNRFVKLHTQSNPLSLCMRPRSVIKVHKA